MKLLVVVVCVVAAVIAEPQGYRLQRQEQAEPIPYAAAGFRPARQFLLPTQQRELVETSDPRVYNFPDEETPTTTDPTFTNDEPSTTTDSIPTTTLSPAASQLNDARANPDADDVEEVEVTDAQKTPTQADGQGQGVYYVLLPTGQLQKVQYLTRVDDVRRMAYTAQLKYANVQPISGPIYAYDSNAPFLQLVAQ